MTARQILTMALAGIERAPIAEAEKPIFEWVDPRTLYVDDSYQRAPAGRSLDLIHKIVGGWDWAAFKPPVCVMVGNELHVVDGQHTAIAAASHGSIETIPVMIIDAVEVKNRATAFVKHNRDRVPVTRAQLHHAMVAAEDDVAVTIKRLCDKAGATVLQKPAPHNEWKAGQTIALAAIQQILNKRYAQGARRVVEVCVKAELAPISALYLKAVDEVLFGKDFKGTVQDDDVAAAVRAVARAEDPEPKQIAMKMNAPLWMGLAVVIHRNTRKVRGAPEKAA